MTWLTQTKRFLQLDTPLEPDVLIPIHFSGEEALSQPFEFALQMISNNTHIDPSHLLGRAITLTLNTSSRALPRYFNGYVHHFQAGRIVEGTRYYEAIIKPWISFLNYTSDCRVFQQQTVVQIAEQIFEDCRFTHFNTSGLSNSYKKREYCVQYRETALHFVSRLFQEEGIYYFFKHEAGKHTLMLGDSPAAIKPAPEALAIYKVGSEQDPCITRFERNYQFYTGKVVHADYNHETPDNPLQAQQQRSAKLKAAQNYEHFDYPGIYQDYKTGESLAQQRFEAQEAQYDSLLGESNYASFSSGSKFSIENAPAATDNGDFAIISMMHDAQDGSYLHDITAKQSYRNQFTCIPSATPFKPRQTIAKPRVNGAQSALVVGGDGEELDTGHYGQVKVQFHWDRKGKKNEYSSCWMRVAQLWAGKNWGAMFMPRIGQEVIVHFLEGDPDRPIIMGSVYNGDNLPPYSLPGEQTKSGIRTSSTKGAGADEYNELRFDDQQGSEEIYIQAQKDLKKLVKHNLGVTVQNDHTHDTTHNSTVTVGNDYRHATTNNSTVTVGNNYSHATTNNAIHTVGNDHSHSTSNDSTVSVGRNYSHDIIHNATISVGNDFNHSTSHDASLYVGSNLSHTISKNATLNVGNNANQAIENNLTVNVGNEALMEANNSITFRVGSNSFVMNAQGIFINGMQVKVNQSG